MTYHEPMTSVEKAQILYPYYHDFETWMRTAPDYDNRKAYMFQKDPDGSYHYPQIDAVFKAWVAGVKQGRTETQLDLL